MHLLNRITNPAIAVLAAVSLVACNAVAGDSEPRSDPPTTKSADNKLQQIPLTITTEQKELLLTVEVARTAEDQARGLMFRTKLQPDAGMIFPFEADRMASFWMKNTVIPLDIIFIRRDGTIESIAANTIPYSLDSVQSGEPVAAVLEIAGGRAAELGIAAGDTVRW